MKAATFVRFLSQYLENHLLDFFSNPGEKALKVKTKDVASYSLTLH